ncbi:hypothetical protein OC25_07465 [Pedobacter kyungheensis]|uniref:DUF3823 domain-containing protein n=1 Tax=Pedobacter kyungheensis TaxID=1069985 RepID=A0A0C1DC63_9SPHI|nr:DUF3823 domain-containing protein [Pedobacter kyungheensis]KIA95161.1 hypothetical protein OC25_07465 [Pedobacter kyungheensis]
MKNRFYFIIGPIIAVLFSACKKDNYDAPQADFTGRIVYKGEPIGVQYGQVNFELWQSGFGNYSALNVNVNQEGSFSAKLFDGNYKLVFSVNQGPFLWKTNAAGKQDTLAVNISGSKTMDIEVTPYYMIRGATLTAASGKVNGFCKLEKIITDANAKNVESVSLYINKTQFVDGGNNFGGAAVQTLSGAAIADLNNLNLSVTIPAITPAQNYVFARIGVKIAGVDDMIFTPVAKITY